MSTEARKRGGPSGATGDRRAWSRVTRLEWGGAALVAVILVGLTIAEPDILGAPLENARTMVFTVGGTIVAGIALLVMLRMRVQPIARVLVLGVPFVLVSWWLLSPFFIDDVVEDDFATSIAAAGQPPASGQVGEDDPEADAGGEAATGTPPAPSEPALLGNGAFVGLAGHDGSGDAGFFALEGGELVLRLEDFDIQNGPDLRLYVVPGADQTDPAAGSLDLGALRGNVGNQTYELPDSFELLPGDWTVLVWCDAFSVEFVAATVTVR